MSVQDIEMQSVGPHVRLDEESSLESSVPDSVHEPPLHREPESPKPFKRDYALIISHCADLVTFSVCALWGIIALVSDLNYKALNSDPSIPRIFGFLIFIVIANALLTLVSILLDPRSETQDKCRVSLVTTKCVMVALLVYMSSLLLVLTH